MYETEVRVFQVQKTDIKTTIKYHTHKSDWQTLKNLIPTSVGEAVE